MTPDHWKVTMFNANGEGLPAFQASREGIRWASAPALNFSAMDTQSGRVYPPDEFAARTAGRVNDSHQAEFESRLAQARIVEVSDDVALAQLVGAEKLARKARRRAAKAARKRNR